MSRTFGRNEMDALIGGPENGAEEMTAFRRTGRHNNPHQSSTRTTVEEVDISTMTAAETEKMLRGKYKSSYSNQRSSRYRSKNKVLTHHRLLADELSKQQQQEKTSEAKKKIPQQMQIAGDAADDGDEAEFLTATTAVVVSQRPSIEERRRSPTRSDSSSCSSSSFSDDDEDRVRKNSSDRNNSRNRRRRGYSSSSSSDEGDSSRRNQRVLVSRGVQEELETIVPKTKAKAQLDSNTDIKIAEEKDSFDDNIIDHKREMYEQPASNNRKMSKPTKLPVGSRALHSSSGEEEASVGSSDSSSSSSDTSSSSSSSSSSSDDEESIRLKPIFVPKHKRILIQTEERKFEEEELKLHLDNEWKSKRKTESRALVAKESARSNPSLQTDEDANEHQDEESGGAINLPPNDDDEFDKEKERNRWEIRELNRLLRSLDVQEKRRMAAQEYSRRKKLTDIECLKEDIESGRYQAPGTGRGRDTFSKNSGTSGPQRFFHRGAYYMDESEWDQGDIRQKAVEYAGAATGEDKIDKSKLPEIMQVKNFGRSGQNQRYKGLAKEDTSNKSDRLLPLRKASQRTKRFEEK
mmetsp:Transcript_20821/g.49256  ORF Transcript_20821/g.49256 Transcript_20821/m.49256 type:complete len:577 (+) Transcript_20821:75-1805(+)|eukprot:CAMPEP_0197177450 /NCGR_PEP_ID=MMETSP1423-20130617/3044_1 /TAXON_ID=476441 /ORGANISM="Pseudo-nitzschia heimii, Strain UNC1101" /LENGTH=576 /DNA_ID=CAMNT_0042626991 /DNA_START=65 /DNA_END=1795 /DNA_ORIENTATION=-